MDTSTGRMSHNRDDLELLGAVALGLLELGWRGTWFPGSTTPGTNVVSGSSVVDLPLKVWAVEFSGWRAGGSGHRSRRAKVYLAKDVDTGRDLVVVSNLRVTLGRFELCDPELFGKVEGLLSAELGVCQ